MNLLSRATLALLACTAGAAHAGRPLATEDADVLDVRSCEWESFGAQIRPAGSAAAHGWTTQLGCGVGSQSQVALAYDRSRSEGVATSGWLLGGKTRLVERSDGQAGLALAWGATATREDGSTAHDTSYLNLVASRELAPGLTGHANLGWLFQRRADTSTTTWNLALEQALAHGVDVMGELYGDDRTRPWLGLGLRWAATERLSLNASWATQNESPRVRQWTVGFKLAF